jgi:hypothetical protein
VIHVEGGRRALLQRGASGEDGDVSEPDARERRLQGADLRDDARDEAAHAHRRGSAACRRRDDGVDAHVLPAVDHAEAAAGEHDLEDRLPDVVDVSLEDGDDDRGTRVRQDEVLGEEPAHDGHHCPPGQHDLEEVELLGGALPVERRHGLLDAAGDDRCRGRSPARQVVDDLERSLALAADQRLDESLEIGRHGAPSSMTLQRDAEGLPAGAQPRACRA